MNKLVEVKKDKIFCKSNVVGDVFKKEHKNVLRDIEKVLKNCSKEFSQLNYELSTYKVRGKEYPCYNLTKDGFVLLAMGYTGKEAMKFKELYINKFNEMERILTSQRFARVEFKDLTDNIQLVHEEPKFYHFSNEADLINRIVLGMSSKQFKEKKGLKKSDNIRTYLTEDQLKNILLLQRIDSGLVLTITDFKERQKMLKDIFKTKIKLLEN